MIENCSLVILTALKEEFKYFSDMLNIDEYNAITKNRTKFYPFIFKCKNNNFHRGVLAFIGDMGPADAQAVTIIALTYFTPEYFITIGVSGSLDDDVKIGDVIFAINTENYEYRGKWRSDKDVEELSIDKFEFGGDTQNVDQLKDIFENFDIQSKEFMESFYNESDIFFSKIDSKTIEMLKADRLIGDKVSIHTGLVCTGNSVCASDLFKKTLKNHNRNYLAVDMETWGYAKALKRCDKPPVPIFIRCISDPADHRKKMLDKVSSGVFREFSVKNGFKIMSSLMYNDLDFSKTYDNPDDLNILHDFIIENYIDFSHDLNNFEDLTFCKAIENLFDLVGDWNDINLGLQKKLPIYHSVKTLFLQNNRNSLIIKGPNGTGKSTFLTYLYFQLRYDFESKRLDKIPIYINMKKYNRDKRFLQDEEKTQNNFLDDFKRIKILCKNEEIILIVDGIDELFSQTSRFSNFVLNYLKKSQLSSQIIGFCISDHIYHHEAQRKVTDVHFDNPQFIIEFNRMNINSDRFETLVEKFISLNNIVYEGIPVDSEDLIQKLKSFKLEYVDIFLMSIILDKLYDPIYKEIDNIHRFISMYCNDFIHGKMFVKERDALLKISKLAHSICINKSEISSAVGYETIAWELCNIHSTIRNYLIAYFTITKLCQVSEDDEEYKYFDFVYPYEINIFCKSLINQNIASQQSIYNNIQSIYNKVQPVAKAHFCYLLGRIKDQDDSLDVKGYLDEILDNELKEYKNILKSRKKKYKDEVMLLLRSIYISLVYLGHEEASENYIERIIHDEYWNSVNRGFHLQYYGDIKYDPKENLSLTDKGGDISITFRLLSERLLDRIKKHDNLDSFDIELFTLCSLSHNRFMSGNLSDDKKEVLLNIIERYLKIGSEKKLMFNYIKSVRYDLSTNEYSAFDIIDKLYSLKTKKRSGWIKRGVTNPESIADHTCFTMFLALLLIPERISEFKKKVDKNKIIKMLLIHDMAESIVGDKITDLKNIEDQKNELFWVMHFSFLGLKNEFPDCNEIRELYEDFEKRKSPEAKIAKDIDKLEPIIQAYLYHKEGYKTGLEEWKSKQRMKTNIGNLIKNRAIDYFEKNFNR